MLRKDDIEAAVEAGILSQAQAAQLETLAADRRRSRVYALGREERFRLLGGFNDFFIALGVVLLGSGLWSVSSLQTHDASMDQRAPFVAAFIVFVLIFWALAEYLTGRLRLVAPSIVIVVFLAIFASLSAAWVTVPAKPTDDLHPAAAMFGIAAFTGAVGIVALHYLRFRLPFSLFLLAISAVGLCGAVLGNVLKKSGITSDLILDVMPWYALVAGLTVFTFAMRFDTSDTERTSRRADCGFWLHLIAAPLIVHPLVTPFIRHPLFGQASSVDGPVSTGALIAALVLVLALALVAIVVDRRAMLVAGLGYLGGTIAFAMSKIAGSATLTAVSTLVFMGTLIITLGVGWRSIRAVVMGALPGQGWKRHLPPFDPPAPGLP
jgi:hypothetical protein